MAGLHQTHLTFTLCVPYLSHPSAVHAYCFHFLFSSLFSIFQHFDIRYELIDDHFISTYIFQSYKTPPICFWHFLCFGVCTIALLVMNIVCADMLTPCKGEESWRARGNEEHGGEQRNRQLNAPKWVKLVYTGSIVCFTREMRRSG